MSILIILCTRSDILL